MKTKLTVYSYENGDIVLYKNLSGNWTKLEAPKATVPKSKLKDLDFWSELLDYHPNAYLNPLEIPGKLTVWLRN